MTILVLLILATMWAAVLLPPMLRNRRAIVGGRDSVGAFRSQLDTLGRTAPVVYAPARRIGSARAPLGSTMEPSTGPVPSLKGMPRSADEAERRRRDIVRLLAAAAVLTLIVALLMPSISAWLVHLAVDGALAGYVVLMTRHRALTVERDQKVHYLHPAAIDDEDHEVAPLLLRSSGS